jgi:hypothetical protein
MIDEQMDKAARKLPTKVKPMWRQIRREYKEGIKPFNTKLVRDLINMDKAYAEQVVKKVFKPTTPKRVLMDIKDAVGEKKFHDMSMVWLEDAVYDATKEGQGVNINKLGAMLKAMNKRGQLAEMFSADELRRLRGITKYLDRTKQDIGTSSGRIFIQLKQAGAISAGLGALYGGARYDSELMTGGGVVVLASPYVLARLLTGKHTGRMLIHGFSLPKGSPQLVTLAARLNKEIKKLEKQEREETQEGSRAPFPIPTR